MKQRFFQQFQQNPKTNNEVSTYISFLHLDNNINSEKEIQYFIRSISLFAESNIKSKRNSAYITNFLFWLFSSKRKSCILWPSLISRIQFHCLL